MAEAMILRRGCADLICESGLKKVVARGLLRCTYPQGSARQFLHPLSCELQAVVQALRSSASMKSSWQ
jgi:hypothetical protein